MKNYGLKRRCAIFLTAALMVNVFDLPVLAAEIPADIDRTEVEKSVDISEELTADEITDVAGETDKSWKISDESEISEKEIFTPETEELSEESISETEALIDEDVSASYTEPQNNENIIDTSEVTYIDSEGKTKTANDVIALTGEETGLDEGWYVAKGMINYTAGITLTGEVHIILADTSEVTIGTEEFPLNTCAVSGGNLNIYGQTEGTGSLSVNVCSTDTDCDGIVVDNYNQYGGNVTVNSFSADGTCSGNGIYANNGHIFIYDGMINTNSVGDTIALRARSDIFIYGGIVVANNPDEVGYGMGSEYSIIQTPYTRYKLGDYIFCSDYYLMRDDMPIVINGHCFAACDGETVAEVYNIPEPNYWNMMPTLNKEQREFIGGKTLYPVYPIWIDENITLSGDGIIMTSGNEKYAKIDSTLRVSYKKPSDLYVPDGYEICYDYCTNMRINKDGTFKVNSTVGPWVEFKTPYFVTSSVSYVNENDEVTQVEDNALCILLTGRETLLDQHLDGNVYFVVADDLYYSEGIKTGCWFYDIKIIISDGCSMNIGTPERRVEGYGIGGNELVEEVYDNNRSLYVYGQKDHTGTLNIYSKETSISLHRESYYQEIFKAYGVNINCDSLNGYGIKCGYLGEARIANSTISINAFKDAFEGASIYITNSEVIAKCIGDNNGNASNAIFSENRSIIINGGKITAIGTNGGSGFKTDYINSIVELGWNHKEDYIFANKYDGSVFINKGKRFMICSENGGIETVEGIIGSTTEYYCLSEDEINAIAGKILRPFGYIVTVEDGITHGVSESNIGGTNYYLYHNDDSEVLSVPVPATGMKKITVSSGTVKSTGTSGEFILTGLDNDTTVSVNDVTIMIDEIDDQTYTGSGLTPVLTVRDGDKILTEDTDYIISYSDNINSGTATATVVGLGAYVGSVTKNFEIAKADHENKESAGTAKFGLRGTVELAGLMESGASLEIENEVSENSIFNGTPVIAGTKFNYSLKDDPANQGRKEAVIVKVKDSDNYKDYTITVTVTIVDCEHTHTEIRGKKTATCTEKGYTGDTYCMECGNLVVSGSETDIDPDNHSYDMGVVTTEPTVSTEGVKTFTCKRCHHTYTETVPKLVSKEVIGDINTEDTKGKEGKSSVDVQTHPKDNGSTETTVTVGGQKVAKTVKDQDGNVTETETTIWIGGLKESYTYTGAVIKPVINVYDGTKMLKEGVDYSLSYANNKNAGQAATITVKFKGNYSGGVKYNGQNKKSLAETFRIDPAVLGNDAAAHVDVSDMVIASTGKDQKPVPVISWKETGKSINKSGFTYEYYKGEIADGSKIDSIKDEGTYKVLIKPKENNKNFTGTAQATVTVMSAADKNKLLSKASVKFKTYTYTGKAIEPGTDTYTVKLGGQELEKGRHFTVTFSNNVEPGKATAVFTAVQGSGYYGSKTVNFTIGKGRKLLEEGAAGSDFRYEYSKAVPVAKGGAKPGVVVKDGSISLEEGTDYAVSYSRNTKVTDGATAVMTVKGKGKYKGSVKLYYSVTKQDIGVIVRNGGKISAEDKAESGKGFMKPVITLTDLSGKNLKNGTDYEIINYTVKGADGRSKGTVKAGEQSGITAEIGDIITVTVSGKGKNYTGSASADYRYLKESAMLGKVKTKKLDSKPYNGYEVKLTAEDLAGKLFVIENGTEKPLILGEDYRIVGYSNNTKKGTAKITLQGIGKFGGTRTLSFKITERAGDCQGALVGGEWK